MDIPRDTREKSKSGTLASRSPRKRLLGFGCIADLSRLRFETGTTIMYPVCATTLQNKCGGGEEFSIFQIEISFKFPNLSSTFLKEGMQWGRVLHAANTGVLPAFNVGGNSPTTSRSRTPLSSCLALCKGCGERLCSSLQLLRLRLRRVRLGLITASTPAPASTATALVAVAFAAPAVTSAAPPSTASWRRGATPVQLRLVPKCPRRTATVLGNADSNIVSIYAASIHLTHCLSRVIDVVVLHEPKSSRLTSIKIHGHVNIFDASELVKLGPQRVGVGPVV